MCKTVARVNTMPGRLFPFLCSRSVSMHEFPSMLANREQMTIPFLENSDSEG